MSKTSVGVGIFLAAAMAAGVGWYVLQGAPQVADPGRPNVLIVVWDTVRADRLSLYGHALKTTPHLDTFAKEGVVYDNAVSAAMWTLPSHAAMFTGLPESAHGATSQHKWLDNRFVTLAEWLTDAGYDTWLFSANPYLGDHTNVSQGFATREFPWDDRWKKQSRRATLDKLIARDASTSLSPKYVEGEFPSGRPNDKVKDAGAVVPNALGAWLDETRDKTKPFFAFVNYMEAHEPRIPDLASREALFSGPEIDAQLAQHRGYGDLLAYTVGVKEFTPDQIAVMAQVYDASLRELDERTQRLFDELEQRNLLDNTIVVVTADHGEHLGEHHLLDHKYSVFNPLVKVPLVIRFPPKLKPARVSDPVSSLNIFATITELLGLENPKGTLSKSLLKPEGRPGWAPTELVHATPLALDRISAKYEFDWKPFLRTYESAIEADWKCILGSDGSRQLYAQSTDPLEANNVDAASAAEFDRCYARFQQWKAGFPAYDPALAGEDDAPVKGLKDETADRLKALGYVDGEPAPAAGEPQQAAPEAEAPEGGE